MTILFQVLAIFSAAYVASQLMPAGWAKLIHVDDNRPTFAGLFGTFGGVIQAIVGFIELAFPAFMILGIAIRDIVWVQNAAIPVMFVMVGAGAVHALIWKNSPLKPLLIFVATLITLVFVGLM